jgi:hypothetical protein
MSWDDTPEHYESDDYDTYYMPRRRRSRWPWLVGWVATMDVLAGAILAGLLLAQQVNGGLDAIRNPPASVSSTLPSQTGTSVSPPTTEKTATQARINLPTSTSTTLSGPQPELLGLSPQSGPPGTSVTLNGIRLFSADGLISVDFGQVQAPVRCPSITMCVATVPVGGTGVVSVTMTTQSGTSNAMPFTRQ